MLNSKSTLEIVLDDDFNGIMYGLPEESLGCKLKGKLVLNNKESLPVKYLLFSFIGKVTVACGPPMSSSRPEYSETQIIYRKEYLFHNSTSKIPAGTHDYSFNFDLPGHLPSSFKGTRGKIEYYCNAFLSRPIFRSNITAKKNVYLKRCLMEETRATQPQHTTFTEGHVDGKIRYQISTPIMTFREGGLVHTELILKSTDSDIVIENIEYGLKEQIHYRTTGEQANAVIANVDEDIYPFGKKRIEFDPNDTNPIAINFRLCQWVNCDVDTQLINVHHKLSFAVCVSKTINIENESFFNGETDQQSDRRFSFPVSSQIESREEGRVRRTTSLLPSRTKAKNSGNSRTFSLSNFRSNSHKAPLLTKVEKKRIHFEIPIVVTTKSSKPGHPIPPYNYVDKPPDYAIASMIPPPPEYVPDVPSNAAELILSEYLANRYVAYDDEI